MNDYNIFICYPSKNGGEAAKHLHDLLTRDGYKVAFDVVAMHPNKFDEVDKKAIDTCEDFVVILGDDASIEYDAFGYKQLFYAIAQKKHIVAIRLNGESTWKRDLPKDFTRVATLKGPRYTNYYFDEFYRQLKEKYLTTCPVEDLTDVPVFTVSETETTHKSLQKMGCSMFAAFLSIVALSYFLCRSLPYETWVLGLIGFVLAWVASFSTHFCCLLLATLFYKCRHYKQAYRYAVRIGGVYGYIGCRAAMILGLMHYHGQERMCNYAKSFLWFTKASAKCPKAYYYLALQFKNGLGVPQSDKKAEHHFKRYKRYATKEEINEFCKGR